MSSRRLIWIAAVFAALLAWPTAAKEDVTFRGHWEGSTVSAVFLSPTVVFVVSSGSGNATHLGNFQMTTPHLSFLDTLQILGTQDFTAANGDTVHAEISGGLAPTPDGNLEGTLEGVITGGTGRFAGATGSYDFHLVARPAAFGFDSEATIEGTISSPGANK